MYSASTQPTKSAPFCRAPRIPIVASGEMVRSQTLLFQMSIRRVLTNLSRPFRFPEQQLHTTARNMVSSACSLEAGGRRSAFARIDDEQPETPTILTFACSICLFYHAYHTYTTLQGVEIERLSEGDGKNFPKAGDTVSMVSAASSSAKSKRTANSHPILVLPALRRNPCVLLRLRLLQLSR
jgi:hypothetical protein